MKQLLRHLVTLPFPLSTFKRMLGELLRAVSDQAFDHNIASCVSSGLNKKTAEIHSLSKGLNSLPVLSSGLHKSCDGDEYFPQ